jgi:hypothetical protein
MNKIQNSQPLTPPSPLREEGKGEGRSFGIENWNLFGLPARSRFGEGRDLEFVIWNLKSYYAL